MILGLKFTLPLKKTRSSVRKHLILECDTCHLRFVKIWHKVTATQKFHFHSMECKWQAYRVGGIAYDADSVKARLEKAADTLEIEYGVRKLSHVPEFIERAQQTCLERYGVTNPMNRPEAASKRVQSYIEHFGVSNPMQDPDVHRRARETMKSLYGAEYPLQVPEFEAKMRATMLERHGVEHALQSPQIVASVDWVAAGIKRHQTLKATGGYVRLGSKPEDQLHEQLCAQFGTTNVQRQVLMNNRWPIDFYISTINTYVQCDGVYWHGLDRPIEVIAEHRTKRDVTIHLRVFGDRHQTAWFNEHHLRLVRITDEELARDLNTCLLKVIGPFDVKAFHHSQGTQFYQ